VNSITPPQAAKLVTYVLPRRGHQVYLVRYRESPNPKRQGWWIPAPELAFGTHPDDGAKAVARSLGVDDVDPALRGVDSFVTRDWHVLFLYSLDVTSDPAPSAAYEEGRWFALDALPSPKECAHGPWELDTVRRLAQA
jgi:hypothetical protein